MPWLGPLLAEAGEPGVMRQVVLDTETTGLDPGLGHRIIEIGAREIVDRRPTERVFHQYINPDREIDTAAREVHGITEETLRDKPQFAEVARDFLDFVSGAELVIHNAGFDVAFIDHELKMLGPQWGRVQDYCSVLDTLVLARQLHPGRRNTLDALCQRYQVDNSRREIHGALLDAELLVDVYLAMTGGQASLELKAPQLTPAGNSGSREQTTHYEPSPRPRVIVVHASTDELLAHEARLRAIEKVSDGRCLWKQLES